MRLVGYDLYPFEKNYHATSFAVVDLKKKLPIEFLRYLLNLLKFSIVPLKKLTVKQAVSVLSCEPWAGKCPVGK